MTAKAATGGLTAIARPGGRLHGCVALVTGGARGIGAAIPRVLAGEGATVVCGCSHGRGSAEALLENLRVRGSEGSIHQGHVGSPYDCDRVVSEVLERRGRLRPARPDEVARGVSFLCDDASPHITGQAWGSMAGWTCSSDVR
jgi:NAD(P)-dependent dehydrogenase (short-subunit alcohol dehydrogenase family)